jgi:hypothetical protein
LNLSSHLLLEELLERIRLEVVVENSADSMSHGLLALETPSSTMSMAQGFPTRVATLNAYNNPNESEISLFKTRIADVQIYELDPTNRILLNLRAAS